MDGRPHIKRANTAENTNRIHAQIGNVLAFTLPTVSIMTYYNPSLFTLTRSGECFRSWVRVCVCVCFDWSDDHITSDVFKCICMGVKQTNALHACVYVGACDDRACYRKLDWLSNLEYHSGTQTLCACRLGSSANILLYILWVVERNQREIEEIVTFGCQRDVCMCAFCVLVC